MQKLTSYASSLDATASAIGEWLAAFGFSPSHPYNKEPLYDKRPDMEAL
jgi:hypothetical protein